jgi:AraC-like DNA-binding protein
MSYAERPSSRSPVARCVWEQTAAADASQRVVPDACADVLWWGDRLTIAGPDTGAVVVPLPAGTRIAAVRLRPGAAGAVLGMPASELLDARVDASEVLGADAVGRRSEALATPGADAAALLLEAVDRRAPLGPDPHVVAAIAALDRPRARVDAVAAELGVSARQLQRRVAGAVGYGPKMLACVLRFRRLLTLPPGPLAALALDAGYADQAHMTAEVSRLAGVPPFLIDRAAGAA